MNEEDAIYPGDDWDERRLGCDPNYADLAPEVNDAAIDDALGLQPISIRLQKSLIEDFKLIARLHGLGYQPLMRQVLTRFADAEKKNILRELVSDTEKQQIESASRKAAS